MTTETPHDDEGQHGEAELTESEAARRQLEHDLGHWGHLIPSQGPMTTFVHHNTLHGLQHLPFDEAVGEGRRLMGGRAYDPNDIYRSRYRVGRITDADLDAVFTSKPEFGAGEIVGMVDGRSVTDMDVRRLHLIHGINSERPSTLRSALLDGDRPRLLSGVDPARRSRMLGRARQELADAMLQIGAGWTVSDWILASFGLDMPGAVLREVAVSSGPRNGAVQPGVLDDLLNSLGVPVARRQSYLHLIDAHCSSIPRNNQNQDEIQRLWLEAERHLLDGFSRRHFGVPGRLAALEAAFSSDTEAFLLRSLWQASLAAFSLTDPFSRTDAKLLTARDPDGAPEHLVNEIDRRGGLGVTLEPALRARVRAAVHAELARLRAIVGDDPAVANDPMVREAACAAWVALTAETPSGLTRDGANALYAVSDMIDGSAGFADVVAEVRAQDRLLKLDDHLGCVAKSLLGSVGVTRTHAELVKLLSGDDIVDAVNRYLVRRCGAFLDMGQAAWRMPDRTLGFFAAWRRAANDDKTFDFEGLRGWRQRLAGLPERADDAIIAMLRQLGVERSCWGDYLGRMLMALPGWAGMMNWRGTNPAFPRQQAQPADLAQYLAVRLFVETTMLAAMTDRVWGVAPSELVGHLQERQHEVWLRSAERAGDLPAFFAERVRALARDRAGCAQSQWVTLAAVTWTWTCETEAAGAVLKPHDHAWRLFQIAQHFGWSPRDITTMLPIVRDRLVGVLDKFPESAHGAIWLPAFENNYRDGILASMAANKERGKWRTRDTRPKAQVVLCIDEREESMHRAIDEVAPEFETFGAGGFFGVAMAYNALDDHDVTPLCPAGQLPASRIQEAARQGSGGVLKKRISRRRWDEIVHNTYWETKRNAVSAVFLAQLLGPLNAIPLVGRVLAPWQYTRMSTAIRSRLVPMPSTELTLDADGSTADGKPIGFTEKEQADKIEATLRNVGMTYNFARLVAFVGHGSVSQNNPHESAHDCGACGGKHGGPNGRAFAALSNRPAVRAELAKRGIEIPDDTHFVGGIHNTASDEVKFFDLEDVPATHEQECQDLLAALRKARMISARERCRRFASSPKDASLARSLRHVEARSRDLSQVRPEWGHCTNAFAVFGRRSLTQGLFLDRRGFIVSYDPTQDETGNIIERIIMALGPVGAGINLEYYFSSVDNKVYGCDTKVPHNVSGLMGVMEGAASDLRTGLPKQMVEIHEAMRLLVIIESTTGILGAIYGRQPALVELMANQWINVVCVDRDDGHMDVFVPGVGFVPWAGKPANLSTYSTSFEYFRGRTEFLPPVLVGVAS